MAKGCTLCGAIYHTKTFCYKNKHNPIPRSKLDTKPKTCEWCGYVSHPSSLCRKNPERLKGKMTDKPVHCISCDEFGHIKGNCPTRLQNKIENAYRKREGRKPINKVGKYNAKWKYTRRLWMMRHPPNHQGLYRCHYCLLMMPANEMTLDHKESRSRRPELRYELTNLVPCCAKCNGRKGSRSHDEYVHECDV